MPIPKFLIFRASIAFLVSVGAASASAQPPQKPIASSPSLDANGAVERVLENNDRGQFSDDDKRQIVADDSTQRNVDREVLRFQQNLIKKVSTNWYKPKTKINLKNLKCVVNVRLMPTGDIAYISFVESSGDTIFDHSVEFAIRKSAPFPVPKDHEIFDKIRVIQFHFIPPLESS